MPIYIDTFTGVDGTALIGTASASGAVFAGNGVWSILSNAAKNNSTANAFLRYDSTYPDGDITATIVEFPIGGGQLTGVAFRYVDANNWWIAALDNVAGGRLTLYKNVTGVTTAAASVSGLGTANGKLLRVTYSGNLINVYYDGVNVLAHSSSDLSSATQVGLYSNLANEKMDDLTVVLAATTLKSSSDSLAFTNNTATALNTKAVSDSAAVSEVATFVDSTPTSAQPVAILDQASVAKYTGGVWMNPPHQKFTRHRTPVPTRQQDFIPTHHIEGNP